MKILSSAFGNNGSIPAKYTCDGSDINPPLEFSEVPEEAVGLVLIVDDPDAPGGVFLHWSAWNIDPQTSVIEEDDLPEGAVEGKTDFGQAGYGGPCPPDREHRYFFKLYALDRKLDLMAGASLEQLENAMDRHVIAEAELVGRYEKK